MDLILFFTENFWAAVSLIALITVPVTTAINTKFNPKKFWKQAISWGVSFILTLICHFIGLISLSAPVWLSIILTGLFSGLSSNGIYDIPTIKEKVTQIVTFLMVRKKTEKENDAK